MELLVLKTPITELSILIFPSYPGKMFRLRKEIPAFQNGGMEVISTGNPHLFGYFRTFENQRILAINNFSDKPQRMDTGRLEIYGARRDVVNLLSDEVVSIEDGLMVDDYGALWLDLSGEVAGILW